MHLVDQLFDYVCLGESFASAISICHVELFQGRDHALLEDSDFVEAAPDEPITTPDYHTLLSLIVRTLSIPEFCENDANTLRIVTLITAPVADEFSELAGEGVELT